MAALHILSMAPTFPNEIRIKPNVVHVTYSRTCERHSDSSVNVSMHLRHFWFSIMAWLMFGESFWFICYFTCYKPRKWFNLQSIYRCITLKGMWGVTMLWLNQQAMNETAWMFRKITWHKLQLNSELTFHCHWHYPMPKALGKPSLHAQTK